MGLFDANASLSYEYTLSQPQRDTYGRITGRDLGLISTLTEPDPDNFLYRTDLPVGERVNGPLGRPSHTFTYDSKGNTLSQTLPQSSPLLYSLSWSYDADFARVEEAIDEHGNRLQQTIDSNTGLVTARYQTYGGWYNHPEPLDASGDGRISPIDARSSTRPSASTQACSPVHADTMNIWSM